MKIVTAIIRPHALEVVRSALQEAGVNGMTVGEVRGFGRQKGHPALYRGAEYNIAFQPKIQLELAVDDSQVDEVTEIIATQARTGQVGDGKIFVASLDSVIRIRTGETGVEAI
ncbi:P-II family nitrogen regulator [Methylophaga sp. OBS1]|jgi:nitrogen regulatory protein PII|uniref:P-II family nitrogen regulator n=1 Tax=Methylophaga sp. OBS1 TaxID=2991933 RepID=UPI001993525B|nr:P-II family nitrogen regulator [Methylophaga sp. OBS1]MBD3634958.1 P-II family nitrogen regulator [Methylophaga sp.]MCX4192282.1 P-II family nitrogen regulator [Methylophaga sp. OBS1]MED5510169.1 P-II family nitrogen regulator [Pseudomonadota bacterium]